jgi:hypothetical protein
VGFVRCCLMSASPERPCDDVGGLDALSRETLRYPMDFLNRPTDKAGGFGFAPDAVFLGAD